VAAAAPSASVVKKVWKTGKLPVIVSSTGARRVTITLLVTFADAKKLKLKGGTVRLGARKFVRVASTSASASATTPLTLTLSAKQRKQLKATRKKLQLTLRVTAVSAGGQETETRVPIVLKR
jgi:hypothetical protein